MEHNLLASKQASKQARVCYLDLFRAFGIILMIMGHVGFGSYFSKWIHVFHMPMFFMISGYLWKNQSFMSMIGKKVKTLLTPYMIFGLFHLAIWFCFLGSIDTHGLYLLFWQNTAERGVPIAGALWFLTAMFFSEVLFWVTQQIKNPYASIIALVISIIGMICATYLPKRLPFAFDVSMVGVGFYQIGHLLKVKWGKLLKLNSIMAGCGLIMFSVLGFLNGYVNLRQGLYSIWPLFWVNALGMTLSFWNIFRILYEYFENKKILDKIILLLLGIGKDSIIYLCLNQLAILITSYYVNLIFPVVAGDVVSLMVKKVVILIISLFVLYVASL